MLTRTAKTLLLAVAWILILSAICRAQNDSIPTARIELSGYSFDPLDSLPSIPRELRAEVSASDTAYRIVQFKRPLTRTEKEMLARDFGLRLTEYIPAHAYLERIDLETLDRLKGVEPFRSSLLFEPAFKISPTIGTLEFRTPKRQAVVGLLLRVLLFPDADQAAVLTVLEDVGASEVEVLDDRELGGAVQIRFVLPTKDSLPRLARLEGVRWIEEVAEIIEDNLNAAGTLQSGTPGTEPLWDQGLRGEGQIIGIIDSAPLDINHCFFEDPANNTPRPDHRKVLDIRNASGSAAGGHATFVAGNAAGDDFNNPGAANRRGGAWASRLVSGNNTDIDAGLATMLGELNEARAAGATIHSNSWHDNTAGAGNPATYNQTAADVDNFAWNNEDHIVLGSAGNVGEEQGPPGTARNAICVGASQADPNEMNFGDGNDGPTADGRSKPDLMAPGCNIQSATVGTACATGPRAACATSYATPHTAAAAALVRQYFTEGWYPSGTKQPNNAFVPSGALIKATLLNATINMTGIPGYPNDREGWGLIRLDNAVYFPGDTRNVWVWDVRNKNGLYTGESRNYSIEVVNNAEPLKVTLVWTEPPASAGSTDPSTNDLNLVVIDPNNNQFFGNHFAAGQSATGGAADDVNNVEQVLINTPAVGEYTIQVEAHEVNQGNPGQGYAVVATADTPEPPIPTGNQNTLVVRVGISDIMAGAAPPLTTVQNIMTEAANYVSAVSYGTATIVPSYEEVQVPHPSTYYYHPSRNVLIEMAEDVIDELLTADPDIFDKGTPATADDVDRMLIVLNDQNFTGDYATTGPWPYDLPGGLTRRISVSVNSIYNDPEQRFEHALGHHFGLIDLYAHPNVTFAVEHVNEWDNMAMPFTGSDCLAWNKERATWVSTHGSVIEYIPRPGAGASYNGTIGLNFLSSGNQNTKAIAVGLTEDAPALEDEQVFYFVEARTNAAGGPDDVLPEEGVLLYYVNENIRQGEGPVRILDDVVATSTLSDAAMELGDSQSPAGRGLTVSAQTGTGTADRDITISYDPPETDNDVNIRVGDPAYTSPDIWVDSQKDGFDEDLGRTPMDRGDAPVIGEVNRLYFRIHNPGPGDVYDFMVYVRVSEPYHTVGGAADFDTHVGEVHVPVLTPAGSPLVGYVEWTPDDDGNPHTCAEVTIPDVFNDVNVNNNRAQQNLQEVASSHGSPYDAVTYRFGFTNPEDTKELFYFRAEGIPTGWTAQLNPRKAHLDADQRIACTLTITPPADALVCTEHRIAVTSWMPRGNTLVQVGGGAVQVDLRNRTELTLATELSDCTKETRSVVDSASARRYRSVVLPGKDCLVIESEGCTSPPRPYEEIIVRYEHPSGYPVYRTVTTDEYGCYSDAFVVAEGGNWEITAEYPGNDCDGPAQVVTEVSIDLPETNDQDGDGLVDQEEPQGDHDGDGLVGIYDPDSDNDGIVDGDERPGDCDRDGRQNVVDPDSDGDGLVDGQDPDPYESCVEPPRYSLSLHGGAAIPTGTFSNAFDPGFNILLDLDYHFTPTWSAVLLFGYNAFTAKAPGVDDTYWMNLSANARCYRVLQPRLRFYLGAGLGLYIPEDGNSEIGGNAGVGLNYRYNPAITLEWGLDYHTVFDPDVQFGHTHAGIVLEF
jgi:M6 family metalloprotease-like protein